MSAPNPLQVLVVDDEPDLSNVIRYNLTRRGHVVSTAASAEQALQALKEQPADVVVSDVMMPGMDGFALCRTLRAQPSTAEIPVFFLTGRAAGPDKEEGFLAGCDDYLTKPFDMQELMLRVEALGRRLLRARVAAQRMPVQQVAELRRPTRVMEKVREYETRFPVLKAVRSEGFLGESQPMVDLFEELLIQSHSADPVLITGETGTGKTLVAEALWRLGPRASKPFRTVNCAELQAADAMLVMGKLFGFGRNSGLQNVPKEGQPGMLEECHGGTLFLDEVARLPAQAQALLLLPAERRPFNLAAGRGDPVVVDVKLIFATNRDLKEEAAAGRFPADLLMRVGQSIIRLPSLRERPDDVVLLAEHFVAEAGRELGAALSVSPALMAHVMQRDWPGNIRELRSALRDASRRAHFRGAAQVGVEHLGQAANPTGEVRRATVVAVQDGNHGGGIEFSPQEQAELVVLRRYRFQIAPSEAELGLSQKSRTLTNHLRGLCFKALVHSAFDVPVAAASVAGPADEALLDRMQARIHQYLGTVRENVAQGTPERLFNNLPRDYHRAMEDAVQRARAGTLPTAPVGTLTVDTE